MAVVKIHIEEFLGLAKHHPVLDVRSPAEYFHAHIPGAYSFPLFTDEERKIVGTTYKQKSREDAIKIGLDFFSPKMRRMVEEAESIVTSRKSTDNCVLVHCWRGGMRSAGVAWLLDLYGFKVYTLAGGYKVFRKYIVETFNTNYPFHILGGFTGSGKTFVLKELEVRGEKIIDLEEIACHKGSAFGAIGQPKQPSQEMFENLLATELRRSSTESPGDVLQHRIWLEDESQRIGLVNIPQTVWNSMRKAPVYFLDISFEDRLDNIIKCYGTLDKEKMIDAITRIRNRLGGLETKTAINFLMEDNVRESFKVLLKYYDKYYRKGLNNREGRELLIKTISCEGVNAKTNAEKVLQFEDASSVPKLFYD